MMRPVKEAIKMSNGKMRGVGGKKGKAKRM